VRTDEAVITGMGMVTPLGTSARETLDAWRAGRRARFAPIAELAGTGFEGAEAATVPYFDPGQRLGSRRMLKYMSAAAVLGCVAAHEACSEAGLSRRFRPERVGLYAAVGLAAARIEDVGPMLRQSLDDEGRFSCRLLGEKGLAAANPLLSFKILANMPPCVVAILERIKGPNLIFTPWEGQAGQALLEAWRAVTEGEVDCALVGAAETAAHPSTFVHLKKAGLLREGEHPGDGAAYLVIERAESALAHRQRVYASIVDMEVGISEDGPHDPLAERMGRCFAAAPAISLGIACQTPGMTVAVSAADGQEFRASLEARRCSG
jgi:3-oxoacyl-[acyl-carrier-protein] synthase II